MSKRFEALVAMAALILTGLAAVAAVAGRTSWSLALLAAGSLGLSVRLLLDLRFIRSNLLTMRRAQAALYERAGQITRDVTSLGGASAGGSERHERSMDVLDEVLDPGFAPLSVLQESGRPTRLLILGPGRFLNYARVQEMRNIPLGQGELASVPHVYYTHVVIDPASLLLAKPDDRMWLQRALRWQADSVMALPTTHTDLGVVATVFGVTPGVDQRGPWTVLHPPLEWPPGWGGVST